MTAANLEGKTAVVTGPTSGIGRGTAASLASSGATVVLLARNPEKAAALAEQIRHAGAPEPLQVIADLSLLSEAKRAAVENNCSGAWNAQIGSE